MLSLILGCLLLFCVLMQAALIVDEVERQLKDK